MTTRAGHRGVAGWVLDNVADVVGYWPLSDAAASGGIHDIVSKETGTYGSGMSSRTVDGETVANFDAAAADESFVDDFANLDNVIAGFCVFELDATGSDQVLLSRDNGTDEAWTLRATSGDRIQIDAIDDAVTVTGTTPLTTGVRYTAAWWADGTTLRVYLNGSEENTGTITALGASARRLDIGFRSVGAAEQRLNGAIGSVVLLDTASAANLTAIHDAWVTGIDIERGRPGVAAWVASNPGKVLAYYEGDDCGNGTTMTDDGPHGYDGTWDATADNSTVAMDPGDTGAEITAGGGAGADGDPGGGEVADPGASEFDATIGAWFAQEMLDDDTGTQAWISRDDLSSLRSFGLRRVSGNTQLRINGSTNVLSVTNATALTRAADGETTIGFIRDSGTWYLYSNGAESDSAAGAALDAESLGLTVGRYDGATEFAINGHMADVVVLRSPAVKEDLTALHEAWTLHTSTITDDVGITDDATPGLLFTETPTDAIGITDDATAAKSLGALATDAIGIVDDATSAKTIPVTVTDAIGIVDDATPDKTTPVTVTDPIGMVDDADPNSAIILPSIDGAVPVVGLAEVVNVPVGGFVAEIDLPSIDGASEPVGPLAVELTSVVPAELTASVYNSAGTNLADLSTVVALSFQEALNEVGAGEVAIQSDDTDGAFLVPGNDIRFYYLGLHVFTVPIIRPAGRIMIDEAEEAGQQYQAEGQGVGRELQGAKVYPWAGALEDYPVRTEHRLFTFASPDFQDPTGWVFADEGLQADQINPLRKAKVEYRTISVTVPDLDDVIEIVDAPAPLGWVVDGAHWIWGQADTNVVGWNYFRKAFWVTSRQTITIDVTADNFYTLYLNGDPILGDNELPGCWREYRRVELTLEPGLYYLGAAVRNLSLEDGAPTIAGFLCAVWVADADGEVESIIMVSDEFFYVLPYPETTPGWTPGQILLTLFNEAQARGLLSAWTLGFTADTDSNGEPWPNIDLFSTEVGSGLVDVLDGLVKQGWIDWRVTPARTLHAYAQATDMVDTGVDLTQTGDAGTQIVAGLNWVSEFEVVTRVLAKWGDGYIAVTNTTAEASYPKNEGYMTVDAGTREEAVRLIAYELARLAEPSWSGVMPIAPIDDTNQPYFAFRVGDQVDADEPAGSQVARRVVGLTVALDENGMAAPTVELEQRVNAVERAPFELLQTIGAGLVGDDIIRNTGMAIPRAGGASTLGPANRPVFQTAPIKSQTKFVQTASQSGDTIAVEIYDQTEAIAVGTSLGTPFFMPWAGTLIEVSASIGDGGSSGDSVFDLHRDGASVLLQRIHVEPGENRSETAAIQPIISSPDFAEGDLVEIDCDAAGTGALGPGIVYMIFVKLYVPPGVS